MNELLMISRACNPQSMFCELLSNTETSDCVDERPEKCKYLSRVKHALKVWPKTGGRRCSMLGGREREIALPTHDGMEPCRTSERNRTLDCFRDISCSIERHTVGSLNSRLSIPNSFKMAAARTLRIGTNLLEMTEVLKMY